MLSSDERLIDELTNIVYKQQLTWFIASASHELEHESLEKTFSYLLLSDRYLDFAGLEECVDRMRDLNPQCFIMLML